jgi:hypothetical protein
MMRIVRFEDNREARQALTLSVAGVIVAYADVEFDDVAVLLNAASDGCYRPLTRGPL